MKDNLIKVKNNMYISKNDHNWYKKVLKLDSSNEEALFELGKEYQSKGYTDKAMNVFHILASQGSKEAAKKYKDLNNLKMSLNRSVDTSEKKSKKVNKPIFTMALLICLLFLSFLANIFMVTKNIDIANKFNIFKHGTENVIYNVHAEEKITKEKNTFFYYGNVLNLKDIDEDTYIANMRISADLKLTQVILKATKELEDIQSKTDKSKILLNMRYANGEIAYQVLWDKDSKDNYEFYIAKVEGEKSPFSLSKFNESKNKVIVDTKGKKAYLLENHKITEQYPVSIGDEETPTPIGMLYVENKALLSTESEKSMLDSKDKEESVRGEKKDDSEKKDNNYNNAMDQSQKSDLNNKDPKENKSPYGSAWIGLNKKSYGLHGTNNEKSIGTKESLGCVRFKNDDILKIFNSIDISDSIFIR
ncbi:L,D-transpeptidase family protein [Tepidibacter aestuarii]|uniref:L,D-transpeptidase family protein n=1 Tax=Tepidibacter aestuarii TaxID=2925782 RepID=UPI0020BF08E7|nr:L,D-transpeptidase family protein [Tepidibacter aestuarii]CAH2214162.1 protein of unknown function [Tepidibacter aestuarii]